MKRFEFVFFILGAGLFYLLLRSFGISSLFEAIAGQGARFLLILIPTAVSYVLFCFAWWLTLEPDDRRKTGFGYLLLLSISGFSINYITPFIALGGEPLKMMLLGRRVGKQEAVSSVIAYNGLHVLSHLFVFLVACGIGFWLLPHTPGRILGLSIGTIVCAALIAVILSCHERGLMERLFRFLGRRRLLRASEEKQAEWRERLVRYDENVTRFYRRRRATFCLALGADFLGRAIWAMEIVIMLYNVGRHINPLTAYFVHNVSGMLMVLTFFVPYELGVKEGGLILVLRWLGLDPSLGVYIGVAGRVREMLWIGIGLTIVAALGVRRPPLFHGGQVFGGREPLPKPRNAGFLRKETE